MDTAPSALTQLVLDRLDKIEQKLEIAVRIQERQERHRFDINALQDALAKATARLDTLEARINRVLWMAMGGWGVVAALVWLYEKFGSRL